LCAGDQKTQYAFSPSDAKKIQLFLKNWYDGQKGNCKVAILSGEDYARTGYDQKGNPTKEYEDLQKTAAKERHTREAKPHYADETKVRDIEKEIQNDRLFQAIKEADRQPDGKTAVFAFDRESRIQGTKGLSLVAEPSGDYLAVIPDHEILPGKPPMAAVAKGKDYWMVHKETKERVKVPGENLRERFLQPGSKQQTAPARANKARHEKAPQLPPSTLPARAR
jgi:hypothetical protein